MRLFSALLTALWLACGPAWAFEAPPPQNAPEGVQTAFIGGGVGRVGRVGQVIQPAFTGILDDLSVAPVAAWEMFRLTGDYNGPLIRLRRDSDNAESDFGYDTDGLLNTTAITAWLGGANGFFATIYDQIGSNDLAQSTTGSQPGFTVTGFNGFPAFDADGTDDHFAAHGVAASFSGSDQPLTIVYTFDGDKTNPDQILWGLGNSASATPFFVARALQTTFLWRLNRRDDASGNVTLDSTETSDGNARIHSIVFTGTASTWRIDGTALTGIDAAAQDVGTMTVNRFAFPGFISTGAVSSPADGKFTGAVLWAASAVTEAATVRAALASHYGL